MRFWFLSKGLKAVYEVDVFSPPTILSTRSPIKPSLNLSHAGVESEGCTDVLFSALDDSSSTHLVVTNTHNAWHQTCTQTFTPKSRHFLPTCGVYLTSKVLLPVVKLLL